MSAEPDRLTTPPDGPPPVLLPYQQRWVADTGAFKVAEKGRRTGLTWAEASDDVLIAAAEKAAGGQNVYYIGTDQEMTEEYIDACAQWARVFNRAASGVERGLWDDADDEGDRHIQTFSIRFASGHKIVALASRPRKLRGRQGVLVGDEAAFQDDLPALLKAAMAFLIWGGKVRLISTHDGEANQFNELVTAIRAGKRRGTVHRIPFRQAVDEGLYRRVCLRRGIPWSAEAEAQWVAETYAYYGTDADEELDVIPSQGSGAVLTSALILARMSDTTPLVRGTWAPAFSEVPEARRRVEIDDWCREHLAAALAGLDQSRPHGFGMDFGRLRDLSVLVVLEDGADVRQRCRLWVELSACPYRQQEQVLDYIVPRLPGFLGGAMDATGNGLALAEYAQDRWGRDRIQAVKLNDGWYLEHMPHFLAAMQDGSLLDLPRDDQVRDDLRALAKIRGIVKLGAAPTQQGDGAKVHRHGDGAIALALAHYAMGMAPPWSADWTPVRTSAGWSGEAATTAGWETADDAHHILNDVGRIGPGAW